MEVTINFGIVSAVNLPETDRSSKIDPYISASFSSGPSIRTKAIRDNDAPVWNELFPVTLKKRLSPGGGSVFSGTLSLNLYDQNTFKDSLVCKATLDLEQLTPSQLAGPFQIPLEPVKEKYRSKGPAPALLTLCFTGGAETLASLQERLSRAANLVADPKGKTLYFPLPGSQGLVYVGLKYEKKNVFDVSLFTTQPRLALYLDIAVPRKKRLSDSNGGASKKGGKGGQRFVQQSYSDGLQIAPNLTVYEELKADDLPAGTDFSSIRLSATRCEALASFSADKIAAAHGWKGALTFATAASYLSDVVVDHTSQVIYMEVHPGETMLMVDFDQDNVDIKLAVLDTPAAAKRGYELTINRQSCRRDFTDYCPALSRLDGKLQLSRVYQLDDVDYGTCFSDIRLRSYRLDAPLATLSLEQAIADAVTSKA